MEMTLLSAVSVVTWGSPAPFHVCNGGNLLERDTKKPVLSKDGARGGCLAVPPLLPPHGLGAVASR